LEQRTRCQIVKKCGKRDLEMGASYGISNLTKLKSVVEILEMLKKTNSLEEDFRGVLKF
jgi:hypothetical protein